MKINNTMNMLDSLCIRYNQRIYKYEFKRLKKDILTKYLHQNVKIYLHKTLN